MLDSETSKWNNFDSAQRSSISDICARCKGRGYCGKSCRILSRIRGLFPKVGKHFSGSSPPEIFVGREGYPEVNTGILSPNIYGETEEMSLPEIWHEKNLNIQQILIHRSSLIYSRFKSKIKFPTSRGFLGIMQEVALAGKPVSTEVFLKKPPRQEISIDTHTPLIGNPAQLEYIRLEENPKIPRKVDYISSDTDNLAADSIKELYKSGIQTSNIIKILSAGLLGIKRSRKLVPTRWAVTAVDDTISKQLLEKIRFYPEISEILVFNSEYVGNHYEFVLLPERFSFEVIEAKISGSVWNPFSKQTIFMQDNEGFYGRKAYAQNVTGAYYSNRLALCEYLERIKKQASCLVMRECRPEYYAPLGTGILRETSRQAFRNPPERFSTIEIAFKEIQKRMFLPIEEFKNRSNILKNYKKQVKLNQWL